jgi:SAM-dependent methyltransferase
MTACACYHGPFSNSLWSGLAVADIDAQTHMTDHDAGRAVAICPACGSDSFEIVGGEASAFACDDTVTLEHPRYAIRECQACGLYYKSRVPLSETLRAYYGTLDFTPFDGDYGFPTDAALLAHLRRLPLGCRVLDFGCSTGRILAALGPSYDRVGVEISERAAEQARRRGITIIAERDLDDAQARAFEGIILSDVFEHLVEPTATLRRLAGRLAPSGLLFIVTGLADAVHPRVLMAEHWYFRIGAHLQMLSLRHLDWLAGVLGLQLALAEIMSHYKRDAVRLVRQRLQAALYQTTKLASASVMAKIVRDTPGVNRAYCWTNLPSTDQLKDHVVAVLRKP